MSNVLETFSMQNPEEGAQLNPDFTVKEENGTFKFWYSKAKYGSKLGCTVYFFVFFISFAVFILWIMNAQNATPLILWFILTWVITFLVMRYKNSSRIDGEFILAKDKFKVNEQEYFLKDIKNISLRDYQGHDSSSSSFVVFGNQPAVMAAMSFHQIGQQIQDMRKTAKQKVNYEIRMRTGKTEVKLADKMEYDTAAGLYKAVISKLHTIKENS